ncbi:MAG: chromosome segregation protein SMC [Phycisphaerales bacterium]
MRLAKLTLHGFKSFADRTEFTFDQPVTGVVGPNGCGKSNIVDAIKWVLGERSSKSLRGHEMIDVIFAGSAARRPLGLASVTLTFENPVMEAPLFQQAAETPAPEVVPVAAESAEVVEAAPVVEEGAEAAALIQRHSAQSRRRGLPVDADVVEVERRLYRDGTSKYLINGKNARLRDIRELFLDTGIGADAYSIIEQGKVDAMLLASPTERRTIFEEAAGIAKYKQRRIEAQRKLDRAEANLKTSREQLDNTERRLRIVRGQAAKARKFKELDENLRAWRVALAFEQYDDLRQRLSGLTSRQAVLHDEREAAHATLTEAESAKQESELSRQEAASAYQTTEQSRLGAVHAQQQASQRKGMLERAIEEAKRQSELEKQRMGNLSHRAGDTETAIIDQRESIGAISEQLAEAERRLAAAGASRAGVLEELNERRHAAQQKQASAARIDRERIQLLASIHADSKRADSVREQLDRLAQKAGRINDDERTLREGIAAGRTALDTVTAQAADSEVRLRKVEEEIGRLSADRRERAERVNAAGQELVRLDSRRATLQEMVETRAGFAESVRGVLAQREAGKGFAGVIAPLADLIQTSADAEAAAAVETALGTDLQGLVVESVDALPTAEERATLRGRVTFLPMAAVSDPTKPTATVAGVETGDPAGMLVSLRTLVSARTSEQGDRVEGLLDRLLGSTFLVRDIEAAMLLSAGPLCGKGVRFVTRDGVVVDADGRVTAGVGAAGGAESGLLRRRSELEALSAQVATLAARVESEREALKAADAEAGAMSKAAAEIRTALSQQQRSTFTEQTKLERLNADLARLEREKGSIDQETAQQRERLNKLEEDRKSTEARAESLRRLQEEETAAAGAMEQELRTVQSRADAAMEQMTAAKIEVGKFNEQLGGSRRELSRLEISRDDIARQLREASVQAERLISRVAEHTGLIEECTKTEAESGAMAAQLTEASRELLTNVQAIEKQCQELGERVVVARRRFSELERDWHTLEVAKREVEVKRETLEDRTQEELGVVVAAEYDEYRAVMGDGAVARIDPPEAAREIDALRDAVKKLGSVNLDSISEEDQLAEQNEDLVKQVADLDQASTQLKELITKLNEVSRERFGEVFTKIQENFGSQEGMFRRLFGGGKAEVRLMPLMKEVENADGSVTKVETEETDLLESGIEVIAKPPGKEPRAISQLSGGEKTLTAVALLMSIFRSKPSCFCVLDEVDAALDEGNVARFNSTIRQFTDLSSFIVITHNKRTMQNTDRLFGVTMQERGVSTRVSVRFEDVGKNGEIRAPKAADSEPPLIEVRAVDRNAPATV